MVVNCVVTPLKEEANGVCAVEKSLEAEGCQIEHTQRTRHCLMFAMCRRGPQREVAAKVPADSRQKTVLHGRDVRPMKHRTVDKLHGLSLDSLFWRRSGADMAPCARRSKAILLLRSSSASCGTNLDTNQIMPAIVDAAGDATLVGDDRTECAVGCAVKRIHVETICCA